TEDIVGMFPDFKPKFVKRYADLGVELQRAVQAYASEVRARSFPGPEHCFPSNLQVATSSSTGCRRSDRGRAAASCRRVDVELHRHGPHDRGSSRTCYGLET